MCPVTRVVALIRKWLRRIFELKPMMSNTSYTYEAKPDGASVSLPPLMVEWCGIDPGRDAQRHEATVKDWYAELCAFGLPSMRLVMPWLIDIAALLRMPHPAFREAFCGRKYVERFLTPLSNQSGVRYLSRVYQQAEQGQAAMTARFVRRVVEWALQGLLSQGEARWLVEEGQREVVTAESELRKFYELAAGLSGWHAEPDRAVPPLDQFLIAVMGEIPGADKKANRQLIDQCLKSDELQEDEFRPRDVVPVFGEWHDLSRNPGLHVSVQRVRKTTDMQLIRDVVPHELALMKTANGRRHFLDKIANEGILIRERQHFTDHERTTRVLFCVTAAIGEKVNTRPTAFYLSSVTRGVKASEVASREADYELRGAPGQSTVQLGSSVDTRVRAFLFDVLRDLTRLVNDPELHVEVRVFLECPEDSELNRSWRGSLDELRRCLAGNRYEFMLELESRIPGYFLEQAVEQPIGVESSRTFIERTCLGASGFDRHVFAFVGSRHSMDGLVPHGMTVRRHQGETAPSSVFCIQVGTAGRRVDVASSGWRGRQEMQWKFRSQPDEECRRSLVEATVGSVDVNRTVESERVREVYV